MNVLNQELAEPPAAAGNVQERETYRMMLEWKSKYAQALEVQNAMEAEVEQLAAEKERLVRETTKLKVSKQNQDMELAQITKQLINGQGTYLEQISSLSEEVSRLRTKNRTLEQENEALEQKIEDTNRSVSPKTPHPPDQGLLSNELRNRHDSLKREMEQMQEIIQRLSKENDAFQLLLSENTISGQFPTFEIEGTTLDDELGGQLRDQILDQSSPPLSQNLKFELQSAQNYIQALKLSLESLVQRLLENPEFEHAIEQSIGSRKVSAFTERRKQATAVFEQPRYAPDEQAYWSHLLTPKKRSHGTRTFSMGVDERLSDSSLISDAGVSELQLPKRPSATISQTSLRKLSLS